MEVKPLESKPNQTYQTDEKYEEPKPNTIQEAKKKIEELKLSLELRNDDRSKIEDLKQRMRSPEDKTKVEEPGQEEKNQQTKPKIEDLRQNPGTIQDKIQQKHPNKSSSVVWDCGSTLYDSFELNSFKRQLDSAITASSARTLSMPHIPYRRTLPPAATAPPPPAPRKHSNKISRSLQKLLKSMFKLPKQSSAPSYPAFKDYSRSDQYYIVYDKSGALTTIPEAAETDVGPEICSLVRRTASERFTASHAIGISCA